METLGKGKTLFKKMFKIIDKILIFFLITLSSSNLLSDEKLVFELKEGEKIIP